MIEFVIVSAGILIMSVLLISSGSAPPAIAMACCKVPNVTACFTALIIFSGSVMSVVM